MPLIEVVGPRVLAAFWVLFSLLWLLPIRAALPQVNSALAWVQANLHLSQDWRMFQGAGRPDFRIAARILYSKDSPKIWVPPNARGLSYFDANESVRSFQWVELMRKQDALGVHGKPTRDRILASASRYLIRGFPPRPGDQIQFVEWVVSESDLSPGRMLYRFSETQP